MTGFNARTAALLATPCAVLWVTCAFAGRPAEGFLVPAAVCLFAGCLTFGVQPIGGLPNVARIACCTFLIVLGAWMLNPGLLELTMYAVLGSVSAFILARLQGRNDERSEGRC